MAPFLSLASPVWDAILAADAADREFRSLDECAFATVRDRLAALRDNTARDLGRQVLLRWREEEAVPRPRTVELPDDLVRAVERFVGRRDEWLAGAGEGGEERRQAALAAAHIVAADLAYALGLLGPDGLAKREGG
jgi:hypothetical protein